MAVPDSRLREQEFANFQDKETIVRSMKVGCTDDYLFIVVELNHIRLYAAWISMQISPFPTSFFVPGTKFV